MSVDANDRLFWARWEVESVAADGFLLLEGNDELEAENRSNGQMDQLAVAGASPYDVPGRKHYLHVDPDLLLHRYDFAELHLLVYESTTEVMVRVAAPKLRNEVDESYVRRIMSTLLRWRYEWYFFPTKAPDESLRFSSEPRAPGELFGQEGVFGAIVSGGLYFTFCRRENGQMPFPRPLIGGSLRKTWQRAHGAERANQP